MAHLPRRLTALAAAALSLLLLAGEAWAHPLALSGFEAWAGEDDVRVELKLDAASVMHVVDRARRGASAPGAPDGGVTAQGYASIRQDRALVLAYVAGRLRISNDGRPCPVQPARDLTISEATSKVLLEERFLCGAPLGRLTIDSRLFHEEDSAPQVIATFHYQRALEHYFFSKGSPVAEVPVRQLNQALPAVIDTTRPFEMATPPADAYARSAAAADAPRPRRQSGFLIFLWQGVLHILGGLDHVLFVVSLVAAVRTRRELVLVVSSFTVAHSITLVLGTFDLLRASPRLVEPLIALSIVYVAVENILRRAPRARAAVTFGFGLVHGLGFSSALRDLGLPARELVGPLLGFNLGVELGQLCIVLPLLPLVVWLRARPALFRQLSRVANGVVALVALVWFVSRLRGP